MTLTNAIHFTPNYSQLMKSDRTIANTCYCIFCVNKIISPHFGAFICGALLQCNINFCEIFLVRLILSDISVRNCILKFGQWLWIRSLFGIGDCIHTLIIYGLWSALPGGAETSLMSCWMIGQLISIVVWDWLCESAVHFLKIAVV